MYKLFLLFVVFWNLSLPSAIAQSEREQYWETITKRSDKIVSLIISDPDSRAKVIDKLRDQYFLLNAVYELRDLKLKTAKDKAEKESITADALKKTTVLTNTFIQDLSTEITTEEINAIKNALTYHVYPNTVQAYKDMIPALKEEEVKAIDSLLYEAREYAIHAESADKKHWWFGQYKGKINNYLSARGYDLKEEGDRWEERRKKN